MNSKSSIDEKEIESFLNRTPEAKSSVSYSLVSKNGFPFIFTVRDNDELNLLESMDELEKTFVSRGYQADKKSFPAKVKEVVEGEKCPKCGSDLIKFTSKDGTKSGVKCSTSRYDFMTKTSSGCDFVRFDGSAVATTPSVGFPATPAQTALLKEKNLWEEGMSKAQASLVISSVLGK